MFTVFHLFALLALVAGVASGAAYGLELGGPAGLVAGALGGGVAGMLLGALPFQVALLAISLRMDRKSVAQLRAEVRDPACAMPNFLILTLQARGEDVSEERSIVLAMLESPLLDRRQKGWAALTSAFPELAEKLVDYRLDGPGEARAAAVARLRAEIG